MTTFIFTNDPPPAAVHVAHVPTGLRKKDALFDTLAVALRFPDYFGRNWDALDECICDLGWLPEGDVLLRHADIPLAHDAKSLAIYITLLHRAIEEWRASGTRTLFVSFPPGCESTVRAAMPPA